MAAKKKPQSAGAAAGAQAGLQAPGYQTINGPGGAWHIYPTGRKVWVAARAVAPSAPDVNNPLVPDAQYMAETARNQFQANQQRSQLDTTESQDRTDYQEALRRLLGKKPQDIQSSRVQANRQGLLDSTTSSNQLGEIEQNYTRQQTDLGSGFDRRQLARTAARSALDQGLTIDDAAQMAALSERQALTDEQSASAGMLAAVPPAPVAAKPLALKVAKPKPRKPRKPAAARRPRLR